MSNTKVRNVVDKVQFLYYGIFKKIMGEAHMIWYTVLICTWRIQKSFTEEVTQWPFWRYLLIIHFNFCLIYEHLFLFWFLFLFFLLGGANETKGKHLQTSSISYYYVLGTPVDKEVSVRRDLSTASLLHPWTDIFVLEFSPLFQIIKLSLPFHT